MLSAPSAVPRDPLLLRILLKGLRPSTSQTSLYRWIATVCVPVYGYVYFGQRYFADWQTFLGATAILYVLAAACLAPLNYLTESVFQRYPEPHQSLKRFGAYALAMGLTTGLGTFFTMWTFNAVHLFGYRFQASEAFWVVVSVMIFNVFVAALFEVSLAFNQWQTNQLAVEQLEHQELRGQLDVVKQQISPHFLFNSLNSLSVLIGEDPQHAERFVDEMAQVYRYLLQAHRPGLLPGQPNLTTLEAELRHLHSYAYLLRTRYGAGLELDIAPLPALDRQQANGLLPLTLQTLVDNAIQYNVVSPTRPLRIAVATTTAGQVRVHNNRQRRSVRVANSSESLGALQARYQELGCPNAVQVEADEAQFSVAVQLLAS
ncbi:sensor histidine kinase [Hymenobacter properus]|uniref:Histidine kinase n=1 Tax=Hymenobacter properus TaxID=2791026 RepID=A0A931BHZ3_9BACT|nr:sensor histidine kinase [Hymenobacter properus]MBF9141926.1 histidine kinase [Hymenobacter properus]MBR7720734.1 histidine kinase [Microvirga sp. SRT04]